MSANTAIINKAFKGYAAHMDKVVYGELQKWCAEIIRKAVFARMNPFGGHNFTGNLINSIVVILYRKSTHTKENFFGAKISGKPAIMRELTSVNARGKQRVNNIYFRPGSKFGDVDWSNQWSVLKAENLIPTDQSYGADDAIAFSQQWTPTLGTDFEICVAYTVEYADFVEQQRQTTGYLEVLDFVDRTGIEWVGLQAA